MAATATSCLLVCASSSATAPPAALWPTAEEAAGSSGSETLAACKGGRGGAKGQPKCFRTQLRLLHFLPLCRLDTLYHMHAIHAPRHRSHDSPNSCLTPVISHASLHPSHQSCLTSVGLLRAIFSSGVSFIVSITLKYSSPGGSTGSRQEQQAGRSRKDTAGSGRQIGEAAVVGSSRQVGEAEAGRTGRQ